MRQLGKISGRLGNQLFQWAFMHAYALRNGHTDGYFPQDLKWFEDFAPTIRSILGDNITPSEFVSIHIRRTDYLDASNPNQYALPLEYYEKAMALFPGRKFKVFSDDIEWCRSVPLFKDCEFSERTTNIQQTVFDASFGNLAEIEDLNDMAGCKDNIIANSTYSWWAAFINPNAGRKVVMPLKWEKNGRYMTAPADWIRI